MIARGPDHRGKFSTTGTPGTTDHVNSDEAMGKNKQVKGKSALRFYHEVLHLDELHFGLWDNEPLTLDGLRSAQRRYDERLLALIPDATRTVLDVGAGTGSVSALLHERGYDVEGLSPDPYLRDVYTERTGLPFHLDWFERFEPAHRYDLVLMAESAQYIPLEGLFAAAVSAAPGGYLLLADFFVVGEGDTELSRRGHRLDAFERAAAAHGLVADYREDITDATLPTMDLGRKLVERHVEPALAIAADSYGRKHPWIYRGARWLLRDRVAEWRKSLQLADSAEFARVKRYLILRYRLPAA